MMENLTQDLRVLSSTYTNVFGTLYGYKRVGNKITDEHSVIFLVNEKKKISDLESDQIIPPTIEISGKVFKTDVVEGKLELCQSNQDPIITNNGQFCPSPWNSWTASTPTNQNKVRPIQGGIRIQNTLFGGWGTMGLVCVDNDTNSVVGLTNSHVICGDGLNTIYKCPNWIFWSMVNNNIFQPYNSGNDSNKLGIIKKHAAFDLWPKKTFADAALLTIPPSAFDPTISWKPFGLTNITDYLTFASTSEIDNLFVTNPDLYSSGAKTGSKGEGIVKLKVYGQFGSITLSSNNIPTGLSSTYVQFNDVFAYMASGNTTPNGYICSFPIERGDSGSVVIADFSGTKKIVGLAFAGIFNQYGQAAFGVACRIDKVAQKLNISPYTGQTVYFSNINNVEYFYENTLTSGLTKNVGGKTFWQMGGYKQN